MKHLSRKSESDFFASMETKLEWQDDASLFALCREHLYTAVVGDIMDMMDLKDQFLPPAIQPLREDMVLAGRAMPVLEADDDGGEGPGRRNELMNQPFGLMLDALDDLRRDEVYICAGASPTYALWGELMSTCAINRGAAGAVVDGYSRDTPGVLRLGLPVFSHGRYARDQRPRGKVMDFRCRIELGGVTVRPGDIVFGDIDGVCVVPREAEEEVLRRAWEKAHGEKQVFTAIQNGMGAREAWDTYGIL